MDSEARLDGVDWLLLGELQRNARLSYSELGRRVGLTSPAVAERMRRLEEIGVIEGYAANLNLAKIGRPLQAVLRIALREQRCYEFGELAKRLPEILECHNVTGEDCHVLRIAVRSSVELTDFVRRMAPYGRTVTCVVLSSPVTNRVVEPPESEAEARSGRVLRILPVEQHG